MVATEFVGEEIEFQDEINKMEPAAGLANLRANGIREARGRETRPALFFQYNSKSF
jgi:hypothetical protein